MQQTIALRYACSKLGIDFDSFVACMIRLETLFSEPPLFLTLSHFPLYVRSSKGAGPEQLLSLGARVSMNLWMGLGTLGRVELATPKGTGCISLGT